MTPTLTERILVPVANQDDASRTGAALQEFLDPGGSLLHFVHVIEKAGGAPDKAPLAARQQQAERIFDTIRTRFDDTGYDVDTELRYGTDVADEIVAAACDLEATAIVFVPRPEGHLPVLLTTGLTDRLVPTDQFPVIVLPRLVDDGEP